MAVLDGASNRLIDVEDLSEEDLQVLRKHFQVLARQAKEETSVSRSHSVDEAHARHQRKHRSRPKKGR